MRWLFSRIEMVVYFTNLQYKHFFASHESCDLCDVTTGGKNKEEKSGRRMTVAHVVFLNNLSHEQACSRVILISHLIEWKHCNS